MKSCLLNLTQFHSIPLKCSRDFTQFYSKKRFRVTTTKKQYIENAVNPLYDTGSRRLRRGVDNGLAVQYHVLEGLTCTDCALLRLITSSAESKNLQFHAREECFAHVLLVFLIDLADFGRQIMVLDKMQRRFR